MIQTYVIIIQSETYELTSSSMIQTYVIIIQSETYELTSAFIYYRHGKTRLTKTATPSVKETTTPSTSARSATRWGCLRQITKISNREKK